MSNNAAPLNEYEKSVLLTQSQESIVIDIYIMGDSMGNPLKILKKLQNI